MIRVLVVGRSGQIAQALRAAAERLEDVTLIPLGRPMLDLAEPDTVLRHLRAAQADIVINAAAYTAVDAAERERDQAFAINCTGAGAVAQATADLGLPLIHLSTDFVFSGDARAPYREEDSPNPCNVYGQSKWAGEQAVRAAHAEAVIVRLCWVYSCYGQNFAKTMLRLAADRAEIGVVADQFGSPSAAEDVAPALLQITRTVIARPAHHGLYHLASAGDTSWAGFAAEIMAAARAAGGVGADIRPISTADYPTAAQRPAYSVLNCARIAEEFDIRLPDWRLSCQNIVRALVAIGSVQD